MNIYPLKVSLKKFTRNLNKKLTKIPFLHKPKTMNQRKRRALSESAKLSKMMDRHNTENYAITNNTAMAFSHLQTVTSTWASGRKALNTAQVKWSTKMARSKKVHSETARNMEKGVHYGHAKIIQSVQKANTHNTVNMLEIKNMVRVLRNSAMETFKRVSMQMGKSMGKGTSSGKVVPNRSVIGVTTIWRGRASCRGQCLVVSTKGK